MITKQQKLALIFVTATALHFLFFSYQLGGEPEFGLGETPLLLTSFRLLGIYGLGIHIFYNTAPLYFFGGAFIPQLFGIAFPVVLLLYVGFASYNRWRLGHNDV